MSKLTITTNFVSCSKSTGGDTCVTECCSKQSGSSSGDLYFCISASACNSNVTQQVTFDTCENDGFNNKCGQKCCGTYVSKDGTSNSTMTICESGTYCDGVYAPSILARLSSSQVSSLDKTVSGGVSNNTAIAVGVGLGLLAIIAMIVAVLVWKIKKTKEKNQDEALSVERFKDEPVEHVN